MIFRAVSGGARGHYEKPLGHCPGRACALHRDYDGCDEQDLQEQPACVVRTDVNASTTSRQRSTACVTSSNGLAVDQKRSRKACV